MELNIKEFLSSNLALKLIALMIATILWFFVVGLGKEDGGNDETSFNIPSIDSK